ncbi:MAG TPA: hypothetical protein VHZ31_09815 [Solirubrobacteraceae bacterium]|nr:hypothetical protein [Solirubrobacteraceae bacterium]
MTERGRAHDAWIAREIARLSESEDRTEIDLRDRVAGCLVLVFAQRISRLVLLRTDDAVTVGSTVTIRFGSENAEIPPRSSPICSASPKAQPTTGFARPAATRSDTRPRPPRRSSHQPISALTPPVAGLPRTRQRGYRERIACISHDC